MSVCKVHGKVYSESDSPFGHIDCKVLSNALRTAFAEQMGSHDTLSATPRRRLEGVLRAYLGSGCSYQYEQAAAVHHPGREVRRWEQRRRCHRAARRLCERARRGAERHRLRRRRLRLEVDGVSPCAALP